MWSRCFIAWKGRSKLIYYVRQPIEYVTYFTVGNLVEHLNRLLWYRRPTNSSSKSMLTSGFLSLIIHSRGSNDPKTNLDSLSSCCSCVHFTRSSTVSTTVCLVGKKDFLYNFRQPPRPVAKCARLAPSIE